MSKKNVIVTVVLMLLIVATTGFAADKYQWKLVDTEDNCQVYTSAVPGKEYIAAKATCVIPARMDVLGLIIRDIANYPEWMQDCKDTKILKVVDDQNDVFIFWFRQHVDLFTDRDMVIKSYVENKYDKGMVIVHGDLTTEIPHDAGKGYIRMPSFSSVFTLEWMDQGHTRISLAVDPDLGKGLPKSVANMLIKTTPLKSLKHMRKLAKDHKIVAAAKASKYNKAVEDAIKAGYIK
ncbi:MAG: hypothetical protein CVU55_11590 [Deltaproteobacteria bacterium HGW-Deltaproteobacteria-13]|jgi:hypothetical protein|nr:MAG: hypothetical protein CVU55_11590 [Deltaproteobacteria bacterium HGW-Deltaproteobacteria-13]